MKLKLLLAVGLAGLVFMGCPKKPPVVPPPPPPAPVVVEPPPPPPPDTAGQGHRMLQQRVTETFKTVYFDYDKSSLTSEGKAICDGIGQLMKEVPSISVRIEGNADERGTNEYNLALGDHRAKAVQSYLASYGVAASRLSVISYGEEKPAADGHDESAWAKNRRDDFTPSF